MTLAVTTDFDWAFPQIGTCGQPCDTLRVSIDRTRAIPDLLLRFDGERDGWVIGGSFRNADDTDFEFREVGFIPETMLDEDRFYKPRRQTVRRKSNGKVLPLLAESGDMICVEEMFEFGDGGPSPRPLRLWHSRKDYDIQTQER